ncbi:SDR family NAD(P)-dependent oxidoreductase [Desulfosporosinus fructosivorans]
MKKRLGNCRTDLRVGGNKMFSLKDKVAIITGAGQGIGRAIALALASQGAHIVIADVNAKSAGSVIDEIRALGNQAIVVEGNVTNEADVQKMVADTIAQFGKIDILVNNAGTVLTGPLTEIAPGDWDKVMAINVKGVFLTCKSVIPYMIERRYGKIVNIASVAGKIGGGLMGNSCYATSKGSVIALTKAIAKEMGPHNINCNAICPAFTDTPMTINFPKDKRETIIRAIPLGRAGKPDDIAAAACFLASDGAAFITGEIMDVNGGLVLD